MEPKKRSSVLSFGITIEESRKKREEQSLSLRKKERDERFSKRRLYGLKDDNITDISKTINEYSHLIFSSSIEDIKNGCVGFRKILSSVEDPHIDLILQSNVVPRIMEFVYLTNEPYLQYEALWCLTNIASGTHDHAQYLMHYNVLEPLFIAIKSPHLKVREQACWTIGNLAGDCKDFRDIIVSHNGIDYVLSILKDIDHIPVELAKVVSWTLSNLCRKNSDHEIVKNCMPTISYIIYEFDDYDVLCDSLWTLTFLLNGNNKNYVDIDEKLASRLVHILTSDKHTLIIPSLKAISVFLSKDIETADVFIEVGLLSELKKLIYHEITSIRKLSIRNLSFIFSGSTEQIQQAIHMDLILDLFKLLKTEIYEIKKEISWCIIGAILYCSQEQVLYFIENQAIYYLLQLLEMKDVSIIERVLDSIETLIKVHKKYEPQGKSNNIEPLIDYEGINALESVLKYKNDIIYNKVQKVISYIKGDSEKDRLEIFCGI